MINYLKFNFKIYEWKIVCFWTWTWSCNDYYLNLDYVGSKLEYFQNPDEMSFMHVAF